ncbi:hypothetical protein Gpo141_00008744, partial [Globisporangium polare]
MRIALVLAAAVALFGALLLLGETERLPDYQTLKQEHARMGEGGYDLINLASPRLFGAALKALAQVIHFPVLGRILAGVLRKDNKVLEVR